MTGQIEAMVDVPDFLPDGSWLIRNRNDRMAPEVLNGDVLVVETEDSYVAGELVVITVDGLATAARYEDGMEVHGRVTGLMRRFTR